MLADKANTSPQSNPNPNPSPTVLNPGPNQVGAGRPIYLDFCPHAIGDGTGTEAKGKLMYAPPKDWTLAQRKAVANSLLVEYDNTVDCWTCKVGDMQGLIYNIDAMLQVAPPSVSL